MIIYILMKMKLFFINITKRFFIRIKNNNKSVLNIYKYMIDINNSFLI